MLRTRFESRLARGLGLVGNAQHVALLARAGQRLPAATDAVGSFRPVALPALIEMMRAGPSARVDELLCTIAREHGFEPFRSLLDEDAYARRAAVLALQVCTPADAVDLLAERLDDPGRTPRATSSIPFCAVVALAAQPDPRAVEPLCAYLLRNTDRAMIYEVVRKLRDRGDHWAIPALEQLALKLSHDRSLEDLIERSLRSLHSSRGHATNWRPPRE